MNLEKIADKQAHIRVGAHEAADLLTSLKQHAEALGDAGKDLIAALEAQGVQPIEADENPRFEYGAPRDLHRP